MRTLLAVGGLVGMLGATAWAVSQDDFAAFVKKNSGVGTFVTTRKACVCHGGALDNFAGFAVLEFNAPGQPSYVECVVPQWGSDGQETIETGCIDKGGTVEVLAR